MKRICGLEMQSSGEIAAVWIAFDPENDLTQVYDCFKFQRNEVFAVIASALKARGRHVPVSTRSEELSEALKREGILMTPELASTSQENADMISREIYERMRTGRFKVDSRLSEWREEFETFNREGNAIPLDSHPLMAATRHAISLLRYARGQDSRRSKPVYPKLAVH